MDIPLLGIFCFSERKTELQGQLRQSQRDIRRLGCQKIAVRLDVRYFHHIVDYSELVKEYGEPEEEVRITKFTDNKYTYYYYPNGTIPPDLIIHQISEIQNISIQVNKG